MGLVERFLFCSGVLLIAALAPQSTPAKTSQDPAQTSATTSRRLKTTEQELMAKLLEHQEPVYPPLAKQAKIEGVVRLQVLLDKDGTVSEIDVVSGHPLLVQSAMEAVRRWKYAPTLVDGQPVEVETTIDVNYSLNWANRPLSLAGVDAAGIYQDGTYTNRLLGFSLVIPPGMRVLMGQDIREELARDAGPENMIPVFVVRKTIVEPGTPVRTISVGVLNDPRAERLPGKEFLEFISAVMATKPGVRRLGGASRRHYGALEFWEAKMECDCEVQGKRSRARIALLFAFVGEYPMIWSFGAENDRSLKELLKVLDTIRLTRILPQAR